VWSSSTNDNYDTAHDIDDDNDDPVSDGDVWGGEQCNCINDTSEYVG
jgi:hypothetical protein